MKDKVKQLGFRWCPTLRLWTLRKTLADAVFAEEPHLKAFVVEME